MIASVIKKAHDALLPGGQMHLIGEMTNDQRTGPWGPAYWGLGQAVSDSLGLAHSEADVIGYFRAAGFLDVGLHDFIAGFARPRHRHQGTSGAPCSTPSSAICWASVSDPAGRHAGRRRCRAGGGRERSGRAGRAADFRRHRPEAAGRHRRRAGAHRPAVRRQHHAHGPRHHRALRGDLHRARHPHRHHGTRRSGRSRRAPAEGGRHQSRVRDPDGRACAAHGGRRRRCRRRLGRGGGRPCRHRLDAAAGAAGGRRGEDPGAGGRRHRRRARLPRRLCARSCRHPDGHALHGDDASPTSTTGAASGCWRCARPTPSSPAP